MRSDEDLNSFTVDTQLQSKFATGAVDHTLLTGVDYLRMRNDIDADYGTADPISMNNPQHGNANVNVNFPYAMLNRREQTGLYAQDQAEWDKWVLTLGGRYDFAKTSAFNRNNGTTAEINDQAFTARGLTTCSITGLHHTSATVNLSNRSLALLRVVNRSIRHAASNMKRA